MMLVCEMMESGDLCHALGRWPQLFCWRRGIGRRVALEVALGLAFLHSQNIVHFDLKSGALLTSILFNAHGRICSIWNG